MTTVSGRQPIVEALLIFQRTEQFEARRHELLKSALKPLKVFYDAAMAAQWPCRTRRHSRRNGLPQLLVQALGECRGYLLLEPETYGKPLADLSDDLERTNNRFMALCDDRGLKAGRCCLEEVMSEVEEVLKSGPFVLLSDAQKVQLEHRREQSGSPADWKLKSLYQLQLRLMGLA